MPKVVDHQERRRLIARSVWQVVRRDGVRGATVRAVAAEAGISAGALRYYFDDHAALILFAARHSFELIGQRIARELARPAGAEPIELAQACLEQLLPLDAQRVAEVAVYFGLTDQIRLDPEHRAFREHSFRLGQRLYRGVVRWLAGGPELNWDQLTGPDQTLSRPLADPELEAQARSLQIVVDGLSVDGLLMPGAVGSDTLRTALRWELERIVGDR